MEEIKLVRHAPGAPGLRFLGLGPGYRPMRGIYKLQSLLDHHSFWANGRSIKNLKILLCKSSAIVTLWRGQRLIGFGRGTSDGIYRAVLWDVVVAEDVQGKGLGREVVQALLNFKCIKNVERIYLMTTEGSDFYKQLGFKVVEEQKLMILNIRNTTKS